ncbi:MAG: glycosyltransferase family 4 protein [Rhodobacteraceae bacterium]|nr:glycosyltransferase family 4 protein [Paracoccaceae bacterium]
MSDPEIQGHADACVLDLTRLVSRVGQGPMTGIDRVEAAYLSRLLDDATPLFALVRTSLGFALLDRKGARSLQARLKGKTDWGGPDMLSRVLRKANPMRRAAESDLRRICIARTGKSGLAGMLARHLPEGVVWINVGHSNLEAPVFDAVHAISGARAHIMVHDMIPLDFPEFQRPGTVELFERRMRNVSARADLIVYNSAQSQRDAERYFSEWGRVPKDLVAHLGVSLPKANVQDLPPELDLTRPYFVTIGTVEPRKNHALLLDVWEKLAEEPGITPQLFIIGNRGWNNNAVFARLDARPEGITELNGLCDGAMAALVKGARAALFPSLAEGFGLPPCEAVLLGTKVVVNDLSVTREILSNIPIYANAPDMYSWMQLIREIAGKTEAEQKAEGQMDTSHALPTWSEHFNLVLKVS